MKRFISLLLTFCMVLSLFAGMGSVFAANSTKTLLNLDFENETDLNALTVKNGNASREAENPALELRPSPNAFRVKYIPTATVGNMELSFKLKNSGSARDSVSAWIYNNGSENGYRAILASDKIVLSHYENGDYQNRIDDAESAMAAGYRDTWHTYTLKRVENTLTLSVDGSQLLSTTVSENATLENGICFSAWNDAILIDDLSLKTLSAAGEAESTILNLTLCLSA